MNTRYDFEEREGERIVYVRPVPVAELPPEIQAQTGGIETLYAVHDADGQRLALVRNRRMAFLLAAQNELSAVNVH